jgi:hypothetical protein
MYCDFLSCYFGAIQSTDCPADGYEAVQVYRDGNPINLGHFDTEEEAEDFALSERGRQLADHGQFGVGA